MLLPLSLNTLKHFAIAFIYLFIHSFFLIQMFNITYKNYSGGHTVSTGSRFELKLKGDLACYGVSKGLYDHRAVRGLLLPTSNFHFIYFPLCM